jgi:ParB/RepB/Spo0J family partition protein
MHIIPLSRIFVPDNRQRREFKQEQINELAESIRLHGLYHPLVVAAEDSNFRLVAGERRLRAIAQLAELEISFTCGQESVEAGHACVTLLSELDPLTLREIELEENTIRVDLTWQERAQAIADLDALRREQHPGHTHSDTAREIYGYTGTGLEQIKTSITLTKHLDDPEIAKAKTQAEASKLLKKKIERQHRARLAESVDLSSSPHRLIEGDALAALQHMQGEFQIILTDPPYGVGADTFGDQSSTTHEYQDDLNYGLSCYQAVAEQGFRLTSAQAHAYIFCTIEHFSLIAALFEAAGWRVWPRPLIWFKGPQAGILPRPEHGPRYTYESILFATKGDKPTLCVKPDVITISADSEKIHAAQKPVALYLDLLSRSALPGDNILDPFAGSGTIFRACTAAKFTATGIEQNPQQIAHCKLAIKGD